MLNHHYFSLFLSPSLKRFSIISPSPWSNTFSINFEERLKKSLKFRDFTTEVRSYPASSKLNKLYKKLPLAVIPFYYHLFCAVCVLLEEANQYLFLLTTFLSEVYCPVIGSIEHIGSPYRKFKQEFQTHGYVHFFAHYVLSFRDEPSYELFLRLHW